MVTRATFIAAALLVGCAQPSDDDDDLPPRVVIIDDDDVSDDDDATDQGTPVSVPESFLTTCEESEPNDAPVIPGETLTLDPPWTDSTDCGALPGGTGPLIAMRGRIDHILEGSWEGDNDSFSFTVTEEIDPKVVVQWDPLVGDLDARLWCDTGFTWEDAASGGLATINRPEQVLSTVFLLEAGMTCTFFVVAYEGAVTDYVAWLEVD